MSAENMDVIIQESDAADNDDEVSANRSVSRSRSIHEDILPAPDLSIISWGDTKNGELGVGGIEEDYVFVPGETHWKYEHKVKSVACGEYHTLVVTYDGRVFSCGNNDFGQLGQESSRTKLHEVTGLASHRIVSAACGKHHSIVLNEWGQPFSWGSNSHGQLGLYVPVNGKQLVPKIVKVLATKNVVQITCGYHHSVALTNDGTVYSWGSNEFGQLGNNTGFMSTIPVPVDRLLSLSVMHIACGGYHSFCLSKSGAVLGWGKNHFGQLGLNNTRNQPAPSPLRTLRSAKVKYITCGEEFSVFLTEDGGVFTCGLGTFGQLGHGSLANEVLPKKVVELMGNPVTQISCGRRHTLTLVPSKSRVYIFGLGGTGHLLNADINASTPQVVQGPWSSTGVAENDGSEKYTVKCLYSGGDRCFVTIAKKKDNIEPDDFRHFSTDTQILVVNEEMLNSCLEIKLDESVDLDLISYLEIVMNSVSCLNGSFLDEKRHYMSDACEHGIDMQRAKHCFNMISRFENLSLLQTVIRSVSSMLPNLPRDVIDNETLRVYIILPLYHEFMNPKNSVELQLPFGMKLLHIVNSIEKWYKNTNSEYIELLVLIYKNVLVDQLRLTPSNRLATVWETNILVPLEVLSKLNTINTSAIDEGYKVPYSTFHINELNDVVDIKTDYLRWLSGNNTVYYFCNYPFLFDAEAKTTLLQTDQILQMQSAVNEATTQAIGRLFSSASIAEFNQYLEINVTRENIVADAIRELSAHSPHDLKKPLRVHFFGEEAEDAGGVRKEFFMLVFREILDPKYGMFKLYEETGTIWFQESTFEEDNMFFMIGLLCGLAIYNFTIVNLPFPLVLYKKILNEPVKLQDVKDLSPTVYRNLSHLLNCEDDLEELFSLNFVWHKEVFGETIVVPLMNDGENIAVTQSNKHQFVNLYVDMLLNKSVERSFSPFKHGLLNVCGGRVLQLFRSQELMAVVIGNEDYDWYELENNAEYKKGYTSSSSTIRMFWEVFHELPLEDKKKFLLYLTGSDRIPIQGMKAMKIIIQPTSDERYLPVAHTCFNLLDLPKYQTKERLKYKLLQAIQQTQGFSLV